MFNDRYYRLIDVALLSNVLTLNLHAGVLPMWKGFHANAWAIINGEQKIGYTLHQVNECMDAGDIYHRFLEDVKPNERFAEVIPRLKQQVFEQLPQILVDVYRGKIEPISQNLQQSFFCTKIIPDDGLIKSWDIDTKTLYNLYRVVAYPYGVGLFFVYRDTTFEILEMSICDEISYICVPGAIVNIEKGNMFVKTKDSYVKISKIRRQMDEVDIEKIFKIGNRLEKWASRSHFIFHKEQ
ncbi:formyltransferase family protein [Campylobacter upsaliensis]